MGLVRRASVRSGTARQGMDLAIKLLEGRMTQELAIYEAQLVKIPTDGRDDSKGAFAVPSKKATALALLAAGFDATRHLALYRGSVTVTNAGWWWWAETDPRGFEGMVSRPVPRAIAPDYGLDPDEVGVLVDFYVKGHERPVATGFGKASKRPYTYSRNLPADQKQGHPDRNRNPIDEEHPFRMAEKRAEGQAAKKARALGVDVGVAEEAAGPDIKVPPPKVEKPAGKAPPIAKEAPATTEPAKQGATEVIDPASIKNLGDLFSAANRQYRLGPSQVLEVLKVSSKEEIADVGDAWKTLVEKVKAARPPKVERVEDI